MADAVAVHTADGVVATGLGYLVGVHISTASGAAAQVIIYDHDAASGTKVFETYVVEGLPVTIFFPTRYAIRFEIGLYIDLPVNTTAVIWTRTYNVIS